MPRKLFFSAFCEIRRLSISMAVVHVCLFVAMSYMIIGSGHLLSEEMSWDLFYLLDGGWRIYSGQAPHVDYHDPVGVLTHLFTALGLAISNEHILSVAIGQCLFALVVLVLAMPAAMWRLPPIPAALFVMIAVLLVLMPVNYGEPATVASWAMSYNRNGWALTNVLFLLLFVPPAATGSRWLEGVLGSVILIALATLKITYFFVGAAAVALALCMLPHVRAGWRGWLVGPVVLVVGAFTPFASHYMADILTATQSGSVRIAFGSLLVASRAEGVVGMAAFLVLLFGWMRGLTSLSTLVAAAFILVTGPALQSQNSQSTGFPTYVVVCFMIYRMLVPGAERLLGTPFQKACFLTAILLLPLSTAAYGVVTLGLYAKALTETSKLYVSGVPRLAGFAVPADTEDATLLVGNGAPEAAAFNRIRAMGARYELTQQEYLKSIEDGVAALQGKIAQDDWVVILDQVNWAPFTLGLEPPVGGNLWNQEIRKWHAPSELFDGVGFVLIPKMPTRLATTQAALSRYAAHLDASYDKVYETKFWIVLRARQKGQEPALTSKNLYAN